MYIDYIIIPSLQYIAQVQCLHLLWLQMLMCTVQMSEVNIILTLNGLTNYYLNVMII